MSPQIETVDVVRRKLVELEEALEMPLVAGELDAWTTRVAKSAQTMHALLTDRLAQAHGADFDEISAQDPDMSTCVENMRTEDTAIRNEFEPFLELANSLSMAVTQVEPDELTLGKARQRLIDVGLALVLRIRKQEAAVRTWYMEAFQRDRGVGD